MLSFQKTILGLSACIATVFTVATGCGVANAAPERAFYVSIGDTARPPIGWVEVCNERPNECATTPSAPRDVVLTPKAWKDLTRVNKWVNDTVKPITDQDHWGVVEKWSYPD